MRGICDLFAPDDVGKVNTSKNALAVAFASLVPLLFIVFAALALVLSGYRFKEVLDVTWPLAFACVCAAGAAWFYSKLTKDIRS